MIEEKTKVTNDIPLPDCAAGLARLRPSYSDVGTRSLISKLAEQCKNFPNNPDGLRPLIRQTIGAIEGAAVDAEERKTPHQEN